MFWTKTPNSLQPRETQRRLGYITNLHPASWQSARPTLSLTAFSCPFCLWFDKTTSLIGEVLLLNSIYSTTFLDYEILLLARDHPATMKWGQREYWNETGNAAKYNLFHLPIKQSNNQSVPILNFSDFLVCQQTTGKVHKQGAGK